MSIKETPPSLKFLRTFPLFGELQDVGYLRGAIRHGEASVNGDFQSVSVVVGAEKGPSRCGLPIESAMRSLTPRCCPRRVVVWWWVEPCLDAG